MHAIGRNALNCIGSCYAPLALREDYREHLREVQREIGFKYIRFHGNFHDLMGVCGLKDDTQEVVYNFQNVFKIYDFFMSVGLKQIVEYGFMPQVLASGTQTLFAYKANVTPPKDYSQWAHLIKAFLVASTDRYGIEETRTWRYEVWNEPNPGSLMSGLVNI